LDHLTASKWANLEVLGWKLEVMWDPVTALPLEAMWDLVTALSSDPAKARA
jgi:hypothetical protein